MAEITSTIWHRGDCLLNEELGGVGVERPIGIEDSSRQGWRCQTSVKLTQIQRRSERADTLVICRTGSSLYSCVDSSVKPLLARSFPFGTNQPKALRPMRAPNR